jgi:hypothetical protein
MCKIDKQKVEESMRYGGVPPIRRIKHNTHACKNYKKNAGCYIATAVYGSYHAPEVVTLRKFRDNTLANSVLGRLFIRTYYLLSPPIADKLKDAKYINRAVRKFLDSLVNTLN